MKKHTILIASTAASLLFGTCHAVAGPLSSRQSNQDFSREDEVDFTLAKAKYDADWGAKRAPRPFADAEGQRTKAIWIGGGGSIGSLPGPEDLRLLGYRNARKYALREWACHIDAVVIARAGHAKASMSRDDEQIYTKTSFEILQVLKDRTGLGFNVPISVVSLGGEVDVEGKRYIFRFNRREPYEKDAVYLLWLDGSADRNTLFFPAGPTIPVKNGLMLPPGGAWDLIVTETRVDDFKADMETAERIEPCGKPGDRLCSRRRRP